MLLVPSGAGEREIQMSLGSPERGVEAVAVLLEAARNDFKSLVEEWEARQMAASTSKRPPAVQKFLEPAEYAEKAPPSAGNSIKLDPRESAVTKGKDGSSRRSADRTSWTEKMAAMAGISKKELPPSTARADPPRGSAAEPSFSTLCRDDLRRGKQDDSREDNGNWDLGGAIALGVSKRASLTRSDEAAMRSRAPAGPSDGDASEDESAVPSSDQFSFLVPREPVPERIFPSSPRFGTSPQHASFSRDRNTKADPGTVRRLESIIQQMKAAKVSELPPPPPMPDPVHGGATTAQQRQSGKRPMSSLTDVLEADRALPDHLLPSGEIPVLKPRRGSQWSDTPSGNKMPDDTPYAAGTDGGALWSRVASRNAPPFPAAEAAPDHRRTSAGCFKLPGFELDEPPPSHGRRTSEGPAVQPLADPMRAAGVYDEADDNGDDDDGDVFEEALGEELEEQRYDQVWQATTSRQTRLRSVGSRTNDAMTSGAHATGVEAHHHRGGPRKVDAQYTSSSSFGSEPGSRGINDFTLARSASVGARLTWANDQYETPLWRSLKKERSPFKDQRRHGKHEQQAKVAGGKRASAGVASRYLAPAPPLRGEEFDEMDDGDPSWQTVEAALTYYMNRAGQGPGHMPLLDSPVHASAGHLSGSKSGWESESVSAREGGKGGGRSREERGGGANGHEAAHLTEPREEVHNPARRPRMGGDSMDEMQKGYRSDDEDSRKGTSEDFRGTRRGPAPAVEATLAPSQGWYIHENAVVMTLEEAIKHGIVVSMVPSSLAASNGNDGSQKSSSSTQSKTAYSQNPRVRNAAPRGAADNAELARNRQRVSPHKETRETVAMEEYRNKEAHAKRSESTDKGRKAVKMKNANNIIAQQAKQLHHKSMPSTRLGWLNCLNPMCAKLPLTLMDLSDDDEDTISMDSVGSRERYPSHGRSNSGGSRDKPSSNEGESRGAMSNLGPRSRSVNWVAKMNPRQPSL